MTTTRPRGPTASARRVGYLIGALVGAALLFLIDVQPGWHTLPFLTADTAQVLWLVNGSLIAGILANVVYLVRDTPRVTAFCGLVTTTFGLAATVRIWQVFPFDFTGYSFDWALLIRVLLIFGIVGSAIAILVNGVRLLRGGDAAPRRAA
jgi:hypothetical protein